MSFLIVGLGNIGPEYIGTRHNAGFMTVESLAARHASLWTEQRYGSIADIRVKNQTAKLLKPNTFMNLSGNAVRYWLDKEKIDLTHLLVIVDDLALPFGAIRLKPAGSPGGHNGLKHISAQLNTDNYARLRFGLGNDYPKGGQIDYVLGHFTPQQQELLPERLNLAADAIEKFMLEGIQHAMNEYNNK